MKGSCVPTLHVGCELALPVPAPVAGPALGPWASHLPSAPPIEQFLTNTRSHISFTATWLCSQSLSCSSSAVPTKALFLFQDTLPLHTLL